MNKKLRHAIDEIGGLRFRITELNIIIDDFLMEKDIIKIDDCFLYIKKSHGHAEQPFTWYIIDLDKTFIRHSEYSFNDKNDCIDDGKKYFYKYLNH